MTPRHVILASLGTHGDVLPYAALGITLKSRGHRVTLAANGNYEPLARRHGLEFLSLVSESETAELLEDPRLWHPVWSGIVGVRWGRRFLRRQYETLAAAAQGPDVVLAASPAILAARLVQEKLGTPLASICHIPWMIASSTAPPVLMGGATLPRWAPRPVARIYWRTFDFVGGLLIGSQLQELRKSLGLPRVPRLFQWWMSPQLAIGLFPDWYAPPQPDWPPQLRVAGFPCFDGDGDAALDPEVAAFCRNGEPPVAVTFGTGMQHAQRLFATIAEALQQSGRRGLLLARHAAQIPPSLPATVRHVPYAPLRHLLPLCSALVHHGGIGTTARGLQSGIPQLIVPHAWDQLDNGCRVERLSCGRILRRRQATVQRVAARLQQVTDAETTARCRAVAARFGHSDPLATAAAWIEELPENDLHTRTGAADA